MTERTYITEVDPAANGRNLTERERAIIDATVRRAPSKPGTPTAETLADLEPVAQQVALGEAWDGAAKVAKLKSPFWD